MAAEGFKVRSDLHIARKLWHVLTISIIIIIYHNLSREQAIVAYSVGAVICIGSDLLRQRFKLINRFFVALLGPFMRKHEVNSIAGTTYLVAGTLLVVLIFPKPIVKLTLMFLAVGDPIASYFGLRYGKDRIVGKKTLQGSMAAFFACTLIAIFFFLSKGVLPERLLIVSILAGLIAAASELIPIGKLDDNFTFPVICSFSLYGLFQLFGSELL